MSERPIRESIQPTYDSQDTGPRYNVTTWLSDRVLSWRVPIFDPFVRQTVHIGWVDLLKALLRGGMQVVVLVDGDKDIVNDVLELDANTLTPHSTRRAEWDAGMNQRLARCSKQAEAESGDKEPW